jgi:8-oxo-dGTP diphosphatase
MDRIGAREAIDLVDRVGAAERVAVVGAALLRDGRVLASRRTQPPHLAGLWEFPGGKVEDGENDAQALRRELREELRVEVSVGARLGDDLLISDTAVLRVYLCQLLSGEPALLDHDEHRWLGVDELADVPWIPVDLPLLEELRAVLK